MTEPYVIVLGNEKGGTGKSTIAMHLIVSLLKQSFRVGSIDTDARQGTLTRYIANRERLASSCGLVMPHHQTITPNTNNDKEWSKNEDERTFASALEKCAECDYIVVDTPGNDTFLSRAAHSYADTVITPLNDSFIDLDMLVRLESHDLPSLRPSVYSEMIWECKKAKAIRSRGNIDWIVLRNRLTPIYSKNKEEIYRILSGLTKRIGFRLLDGFCERVIFRELFINGTTLLDMKEAEAVFSVSHIAAKKELNDLVTALEIPIAKMEGLRSVA